MASFSTSKTARTITITVSGADSDATYTLYCRATSDTGSDGNPYTGTSHTYSGLTPNTSYTVNVREKKGDTATYLGPATVTTNNLPSVTITSVSQTEDGAQSFNISWNSNYVISGATYEIEIRPPGGSWQGINKTGSASTSGSQTVNNVNIINTAWVGFDTYGVRVFIYNTNSEFGSDNDTVLMKDSRPALFQWTSGHAPIAGSDFNLLASDWRRLQDNINDVREYKGLGSYSFTSRPYAGDTFTAAQFNQVIRAIDSMRSTGVNEASSGDNIIASRLNTLVSTLNNIS